MDGYSVIAWLEDPARFRARQLPLPPPLPQRPPPPSQHQAACTHLTVTRLYGPCVKCQICSQTPKIGWVYACTQDHEGNLPEIGDFDLCTARDPKVRASEESASTTLSHWIQKAINDGHYSEQEIETLKAQKRGVRDAIIKAEEDLANSSRSSEQSFQSSFSIPVEWRSTSEDPAWSQTDQTIEMGPRGSGFDGNSDQHARPVQRVSPVCHARVCHHCRTTYRERAVLALDNVLESAFTSIPESELSNRPVSDVNVIKGIVYRRLRREKRTITDQRNVLCSESESSSTSSDEELDKFDRMDLSEMNLFRDLGEIADDEHYPTILDTIVEERGDEEPELVDFSVQSTRPMILHRRRSHIQGTDDGNRQLSNLTTKSAIPELEQNSEGTEAGEVEVDHGIAVTEEGVSNHTPDIITQV